MIKIKPILLLFLVSLIPRLLFLDHLPPSLNWDEVSHGYNAYSILKTAKDEWGSTLPLIFRAYGDYKLPLYIYLTIPFVYLFGLNTLSVKLVSIIAGSLIPVVVYFISKKYLQSKTAFLTALITSFSPWAIFTSRIALEANLFVLLLLFSFYLILQKKYVLSTVIYSFSLFTYNSSRVYLPFYLLLLIFSIVSNKFPLKKNFFYFSFFFMSLLLVLTQTLNPEGQARYKWVSILDSGAINQINELRSEYPRIFVNKVTYFIYKAGGNYLSHFHPKYIFSEGSSNYQFNIPNFYLIHPLFFPLLILGLYRLLKTRSVNHKVLLLFLLIAPIPSAITRDAPHILRSLAFLPVTTLIIGLGIDFVSQKTKLHPPLIFLILATLAFSQFQFWKSYKTYRHNYSQSWQYGYQQAIEFAKPLYHDYDEIIITKNYGEPHEFVLFYFPWPPQKYQSEDKNWSYHTDWYWVDSFDKFTFLNDWEIPDKLDGFHVKNTLLITTPSNYNPEFYTLLSTINFLDGTPAFDILKSNEN